MVTIGLRCSGTILASLALLWLGGCGKKDKEEAAKVRAGLEQLQTKYESLADRNSKLEQEFASLKDQHERLTAERDALKAKVASSGEAAVLEKDLAKQKERIGQLQEQLAQLQQGQLAAGPPGKDQQLRVEQTRKRLDELGALLFERGPTEMALPVLESARDLGSDSPEMFYRVAYCHAAAGQYEAAAATYQRALSALEGQPEKNADLLKKCLSNYGVTQARLGKPEQAAEVYRKAIALDEKYAPAYFNLGLLYAKELKRPADAIEALRKHIIYGGTRATSARDLIVSLQAAGAESTEAATPQAAPAVR
jgi:tetratricopeptide (TPR) repeat protein